MRNNPEDDSMDVILEAKDITKRFPGVLANDKVNFDLRRGEVHALLGENGAGKTTLMNVLYGLYQADEGEVFVQGKPVKLTTPNDAIQSGIGMVHQHFMLIPVFTVAENIMLGAETVKGLVLDRKTVDDEVRELSRRYGLEVDPTALVEDLPVGVQQRVEIVKALYRKADILILDEPTASLTPQEAEDLFRIMRDLTAQGVSIIFITHKLKEVLEVADRITVMRGGHVVGTTDPSASSEAQLASMMVGREVLLEVDKPLAQPGEVALVVEDLHVVDNRGIEVVNGVSFDVRLGEILGVAGVQGNGQTELVEALTGLTPVKSGKITLLWHDTTHATPRQVTELGTGHIPEDRMRDGLVMPFPVADNLILNMYYLPPFAGKLTMNEEPIVENAKKEIKDFDVRTPGPMTPASKLSGGNQQKVIVARELSRNIKLLIASQPTRGLDVGSIEYIHAQIVRRRDTGVGVLLVSTELDEVLQLSDRIAVMYRGKIVAVIPAEGASKEFIGLLMAGYSPEQARQQATSTPATPPESLPAGD
jgi:simple sugar transport system ATP-binding protein